MKSWHTIGVLDAVLFLQFGRRGHPSRGLRWGGKGGGGGRGVKGGVGGGGVGGGGGGGWRRGLGQFGHLHHRFEDQV